MAHLKTSPSCSYVSKGFSTGSPCNGSSSSSRHRRFVHLGPKDKEELKRGLKRRKQRGSGGLVPCCSSPASSVEIVEGGGDGNVGFDEGLLGCLVSDFGWNVRRLIEEDGEMRKVVQVQAEAFHVPMAFFDDVFFEFFKAEVLAGLLYKIRNSPPDRYACLVAEPTDASSSLFESEQGIVGVVDVTVLRNDEVLKHLKGADEYLYVSGIAVLKECRRKKVATVLLKGCDLLSYLWGFEYLALRAYEDDSAACTLYTNAGYRIVEKDPLWMTTWIGRKRRVLMIKQSTFSMYPPNFSVRN